MNKVIDEENFFEFAEALHAFFSLNHEGQTSEFYECLSRSQFNPSFSWSESKVIEENSYFNEVNESNAVDLFEELEAFLEERKQKENL